MREPPTPGCRSVMRIMAGSSGTPAAGVSPAGEPTLGSGSLRVVTPAACLSYPFGRCPVRRETDPRPARPPAAARPAGGRPRARLARANSPRMTRGGLSRSGAVLDVGLAVLLAG